MYTKNNKDLEKLRKTEIFNSRKNLSSFGIRSNTSKTLYNASGATVKIPDNEKDPLEMEYTVRRDGNHIYLYDEINWDTQLLVETFVRDAINEMISEKALTSNQSEESIFIHINSPGGAVTSGLFLYDFLKSIKSTVDVTTIIEGLCASAASLIFLAGKTRIMTQNGAFLMHELSYWDKGKNTHMQDAATNAEKDMDKISKIYEKETDVCKFKLVKVGKKEELKELSLEERREELRRFLQHDFMLNYEECLANKIITEECDEDDDEVENVELTEEDLQEIQNFMAKVALNRVKKNKEASEPKKVIKKSATPKKVIKKASPKKEVEKKTTKKAE